MQVKDSVRMVLGSVAIYVVVAACGSNSGTIVYSKDGGNLHDALSHPVGEASADENQGGSRLKTQRYVGSDGSSQFIGFYDSQLSVACSYVAATDGNVRCVPSGGAVGVVSTGYSDSGCTQPIAQIGSSCGTPKYAIEAVGTGACPGGSEVQAYNVGAAYSGTVYDAAAGKCIALTSTETAGFTFYNLGASVPATTFVEATVQSP